MAYTVPAYMYIRDPSSTSSGANDRGWIKVVEGETNTVRPIWSSDYKTFNIQYRIRWRYSPSQQAAQFDPKAWNAEWDNIDWVGDENALITPSDILSKKDYNLTSIPFDISEHDYGEMQIRVRVRDSQERDLPSEWLQETFPIRFYPAKSVSATRNDDGSVTFGVSLNGWQRGENIVSIGDIYAGSSARSSNKIGKYSTTKYETVFEDGLVKFTLPYERIGDNTTVYLSATVTTCDKADISISGSVTIGNLPYNTLSLGEIEYEVQDGNVLLKMRANSAHQSAVYAFRWADAFGRTYSETINAEKVDGYWVATIKEPPFGVPIEARCVARASSGWGKKERTIPPIAGRYALLTADGEDSIKLNASLEGRPAINLSTETDTEIVNIYGRTMPVSRYGGRKETRVEATAVVGDGFLSLKDAERLSEPHDWLLRTVDGMRLKVSVNSVSCTEEAPGWRELSVSMSEVE